MTDNKYVFFVEFKNWKSQIQFSDQKSGIKEHSSLFFHQIKNFLEYSQFDENDPILQKLAFFLPFSSNFGKPFCELFNIDYKERIMRLKRGLVPFLLFSWNTTLVSISFFLIKLWFYSSPFPLVIFIFSFFSFTFFFLFSFVFFNFFVCGIVTLHLLFSFFSLFLFLFFFSLFSFSLVETTTESDQSKHRNHKKEQGRRRKKKKEQDRRRQKVLKRYINTQLN